MELYVYVAAKALESYAQIFLIEIFHELLEDLLHLKKESNISYASLRSGRGKI